MRQLYIPVIPLARQADMRRTVRSLRWFAMLLLLAAPAGAQQDVENVAAFARLYGVTRWFYPSDAAADLDWNRFAVLGVSRVRAARSPAELEGMLKELFAPLGPGIQVGTRLPVARAPGARDPSLVAWSYRGAGIAATIRGPYSRKRTNRALPLPPQTAPGVVSQMVIADTLRGRRVRMTGRVRVTDAAATGYGALWLRVDRAPQQFGFFDNMGDRPVRDTAWRAYVIEGPIADDASQIYFGAIAASGATVDVDAIELAVRTAGGEWTPLSPADASFEMPSGSKTWGMSASYSYSRPASGAAHGTQFLRMTPHAMGMGAVQGPADSVEAPRAGATVDVELGRGLRARVPLALSDAEARIPAPEPASLTALRAAVSGVGVVTRSDDADVRLADIVVAWNLFRHFYPYFGDIGVDWDARLRPQLQVGLEAASTREAHLDALRTLVADLKDGHGNVYDVAVPAVRSMLPLRYRIIENRLVVTASRDTSVPVGSVVTAINGAPVGDELAKEIRLASGTRQWRESRAAGALPICQPQSLVRLAIEPPGGGAREAVLSCDRPFLQAPESRPDSIAELEPGVWYADLTRLRASELADIVPKLATARAVIFDMRGYPTDIGSRILPYLMSAPEDSTDRWMHVARIVGPFGTVADWQSLSWNLRPATPHIGGNRIFLTDGRAISYAESVMGYVRDYRLGTIVGGTTAGANGNVADFVVPGGFSLMFTGMRVTRHDGRTPFHMAGVAAEVPVQPTLAGIRAGRDEVLERALALVRVQP